MVAPYPVNRWLSPDITGVAEGCGIRLAHGMVASNFKPAFVLPFARVSGSLARMTPLRRALPHPLRQ
jgi:hypothetical protein